MTRKALRTETGKRFVLACLALVVAAAFAPRAEAQSLDGLEKQQTESTARYQQLLSDQSLSKERLATLAAEVAKVKKDNTALTAALIQSAKTERKLAEDVDAIESRLETLKARERGIRKSLAARSGTLAEVLGALERLGFNPPPAILVRPDDALAAIRSAILLGAVVPRLRADTEILTTDLHELSRTTASIEEERDRLRAKIADQDTEKERLSLLIEEKNKLRDRTEAEIEAEQEKAAELAKRASSVQSLIASLEKNISTLQQAQEAQRLAEEKRRQAEAEARNNAAAEDYQFAAPQPFGERKRQVVLPVAGHFESRFGDDDGAGGTLMGDILRTQSGAIVTSPADATVLYAGPFRSYGQLLILDAGDGYHLVLAGMDRIGVSLGQSVLAGEPVGAMGATRLASIVSLKDGESSSKLYVEFRKDGKPLDPEPWWAGKISGRTTNDS